MADVVGKLGAYRPIRQPRHAEVAALATAQGGVVSHEQLLRMGMTRDAIKHRLASGRLHCVFRSVYALGHEAITARGRLIAAAMSYGPHAAISHFSAACYWGFWRKEPQRVHVTVPGRSRRGQDGIALHLVRDLDRRDVVVRDRIPLARPARTLLDLAEIVPIRELRLAIDEADRRNLFDPADVRSLLQRSPGRHGRKPLSVLVSDLQAEPLLRSKLEVIFATLCDEHRLPVPTMNAEVNGYEVDALWPAERLIVEVDSREFHLNGRAFEADRLKDAELVAAGYRVIRVTYRQLMEDPAGVARRIRGALGV